jgi:thiosulfate/3-mercaptopyruvate sulfurtransferase
VEQLVSAEWLADQLGAPDLRVLECTVVLAPSPSGVGLDVESGLGRWEAGHIPGSAYADLLGDLSDAASPLRFTMPAPDALAAAVSALGVADGTRVVLYDRRFNMWATRLWWMLRAIGFDAAAVLDGGWRAWQEGGHPVSTDPAPAWPDGQLTVRPRPELFVSMADVREAIGDAGTCIVNALSPEQHRGEDGTYGRRGHIPGAENVYAVGLVDEDSHRYLPVEELRERFADVARRDRVITYCGGGIAATSDAFVLHLLGHDDVAVYDGSLSEWTADPANPLVEG